MAITFHSNIRNLLLGRGLVHGLGGGITIYSGSQPTTATILGNWAAYSAGNADFLAHYSGAAWGMVSQSTQSMASLTTLPTVSTTSHTGTGAWAILWSSNPLLSEMSAVTPPTTSFMIVPISTLPDIGTIRVDADLNFVAGTSKQIVDGIFSSSST
jgi:hypothetical protein